MSEAHVCSEDSTRGTIAPEQSAAERLDWESCVLPHGRPGDGYRLNLLEATDLRIDLTIADFDALLVVTDRQMEVLWWSDDGGQGVTARLERRIPAGESIVWATGIDTGLGTYELSSAEVEIQLCSPVGTLSVGEAVSGSLPTSDCISPDGQYRPPWILTVPDSTTLQIDLTSSHFDTYLVLEDARGTPLAENDDGGIGLNSRLTHVTAPGEYRVVVRTFGPGETGSDQFSVQTRTATVKGSSLVRPGFDEFAAKVDGRCGQGCSRT